MKIFRIFLICILLIISLFSEVEAVRLKDIAAIKGVRKNQLYGYGLIIGLAGTGDSSTNVTFITKSVVSMLSRMGITIAPNEMDSLKVKNIATVMVTADLPPFARAGNVIDVLVSSIGDAKSLMGGTLLFTPLKAADGKVYAVSQGPISLGLGGGKTSKTRHLTVGRISGGATVEKEIQFDFKHRNNLTLSLNKPDFTTAIRVASAINKRFKKDIAKANDGGNIKILISSEYKGKVVQLISRLEEISIIPDSIAKVVIDERTGTIIVGKNVVLTTVAISHGNLSVEIKKKNSGNNVARSIASRRARRRGNGSTGNKLLLVNESTNIEQLVNALNAIGVSPSDLIIIFQSLKVSGALQAELEII